LEKSLKLFLESNRVNTTECDKFGEEFLTLLLILEDLQSVVSNSDTSGKPNVAAYAKMMERQHSTTNFPTMTCSSGEPNSKTQQTDQLETTVYTSPAACG